MAEIHTGIGKGNTGIGLRAAEPEKMTAHGMSSQPNAAVFIFTFTVKLKSMSSTLSCFCSLNSPWRAYMCICMYINNCIYCFIWFQIWYRSILNVIIWICSILCTLIKDASSKMFLTCNSEPPYTLATILRAANNLSSCETPVVSARNTFHTCSHPLSFLY